MPPNFSNIRLLPLNLPKLYKRNIIIPLNSSHFLYDSIKLVQFCICYNFGLSIHKILVLPLFPSKLIYHFINFGQLVFFGVEILKLS